MATNDAVNASLSGSNGTGNFVGSTSPTLITPTLGVATATSIAFSPTTGGIVGTTTNNNASAGYVGEFISSTIVSGSPVACSGSTTPTNMTSITVSAGDWDVWGHITFYAQSTIVGTAYIAEISTTSATFIDQSYWCSSQQIISSANYTTTMSPVMKRINVSGSTTVYIVGQANYTGSGSMVMYGGIYARRIR